MEYQITSNKHYHETMVSVYNLMNKGEEKLTDGEIYELGKMVTAAEQYEDNVLGLKPGKPDTIIAVVAQKMREKKMTQASLATLLGMGRSKLSEILNGKRKPDITFLKAAYKNLHIDPAFLLENA